MSANNAFSLLNEAEGSDTSYRTIHVSYCIRLTPEMAWSDTLKEDFALEKENVFLENRTYFQAIEEEVVEKKPEIVEEKVVPKKAKKTKKPQKKVEEKEEDLDAIIKEMGLESIPLVVL